MDKEIRTKIKIYQVVSWAKHDIHVIKAMDGLWVHAHHTVKAPKWQNR